MKKSVYSLVLMDDVIRAVDAQAGRLGTSRSNLINQILAEHLSCITPEMRMKSIFGQVQRLIDTTFQVQQQSAQALTFRGSLQYKYHPTINYRVELNRVPNEFIGRLNVSIRTQNQKLIYGYISDLDRSLMLWLADIGAFVQSESEIEEEYRKMLRKYVV